VTTLDDCPELDLTIDGADEIDLALRLIKGGGGALLREKIVAASSKRMLAIADSSKRSIGSARFPSRRSRSVRSGIDPPPADASLRRLGADWTDRVAARRGDVFVTDGGHYILDCAFGAIPDPVALASTLSGLPGIVDHGLFLGLASAAILAGPGGVETLNPPA